MNSQVGAARQPKTWTEFHKRQALVFWSCFGGGLTSHHLGPLKVLIGMDVAGLQGEVETHEEEEEIETSPHDGELRSVVMERTRC